MFGPRLTGEWVERPLRVLKNSTDHSLSEIWSTKKTPTLVVRSPTLYVLLPYILLLLIIKNGKETKNKRHRKKKNQNYIKNF